MKRMHLKFFSFCLIIRTVSQVQPLMVSQPSYVRGTEGGSVTLRCSYNSTSKSKTGSYLWVKKPAGVEVRNTTWEFMGRVSIVSDEDFLSKKRADVEIWDLRYNDSGMYFCVVNIPGLQEVSGNGTHLEVTNGSTEMPEDCGKPQNCLNSIVLWAALGSFVLLTVAVTFLLLLCCRKKRATDHQEAKGSRMKHLNQDNEAVDDLNYAEVTVKRSQEEDITYAFIATNGM